MKPSRTRTTSGYGKRIALVIITVIVVQVVLTKANPYPRTIRLCSRGLSDALFLVCKDRGFNEPFPYSEEDHEGKKKNTESGITELRSGLVQECCRQSCSIEHLRRYCKPLPQQQPEDDPASRGNAIGSKTNSSSYKIVNLPYISVKEYQIASKTNTPFIQDHRSTSRNKKTRKKRRKKGRRKCRCRRLRKILRKVSRETVIPKVPAFQVGTTSPEPIDSIVIFPFKSELSLDDIDGYVNGPDDNDEDFLRSEPRR